MFEAWLFCVLVHSLALRLFDKHLVSVFIRPRTGTDYLLDVLVFLWDQLN